MKFNFLAYPDFSEEIKSRVDKLRKRFNNLPDTIINVKTTEKDSTDLLQWEIEVLYPVVRHEGFTYIATLKKEVIEDEGKTEVVNLVYPANGHDSEDFSKYFGASFRCDHCRTNRNRYTVHLFRDDNDKELMIASTCAKEYFGANVARELDLIARYSKLEIEDDFCGFGGGFSGFDKTYFCKIGYGLMATKNTYISKCKAEEQNVFLINPITSTCADVEYLMSKGFSEDERRWIQEHREKYLERAKDFSINAVKEFWRNLRDENQDDNFIRSCTLNLSMLEPKTGLLAYAIFRYMKDVEGFFVEKAEKLPSNHVGSIGERLKGLSLVVSFISVSETAYGTMYIVKFIADNGDRFTWFSSSGFNGLQGDRVTLTGTVKKHDEYKGIKQTILTRCKVTVQEVPA